MEKSSTEKSPALIDILGEPTRLREFLLSEVHKIKVGKCKQKEGNSFNLNLSDISNIKTNFLKIQQNLTFSDLMSWLRLFICLDRC